MYCIYCSGDTSRAPAIVIRPVDDRKHGVLTQFAVDKSPTKTMFFYYYFLCSTLRPGEINDPNADFSPRTCRRRRRS